MKRDIVIILDNIRSALNVGSIFRTSDCLGAKEIHLVGISPTPNHPKVKKTAIGAEDYVSWKYFKTLKESIDDVRSLGYKIYAVEQAENSKTFNEEVYPNKVALIFGHELTGVSIEGLKLADEIVEIPMAGKKNSLNVSLTSGIVLSYLVFSHE